MKRGPLIGLLGVKEDRNSSFAYGAARAPPLIRDNLHSPAHNTFSELGIDVAEHIEDYGDVTPKHSTSEGIYESVLPAFTEIMVGKGQVPITLGGDHSITFALMRAFARCKSTETSSSLTPISISDANDCNSTKNISSNNMNNNNNNSNSDTLVKSVSDLTILHFDAQPDLYPNFENNPSSHASPFVRILECESQLCRKLISIGIRTATTEQRAVVGQHAVTLIEAKDFPAKGSDLRPQLESLIGSDAAPVYISFDMDVIEPGMAPGVSHREGGGLTVRQAIDALHAVPGRIVGADIVEYNPDRDIDGLTGSVAGKILKEIAGIVIRSHNSHKSSM